MKRALRTTGDVYVVNARTGKGLCRLGDIEQRYLESPSVTFRTADGWTTRWGNGTMLDVVAVIVPPLDPQPLWLWQRVGFLPLYGRDRLSSRSLRQEAAAMVNRFRQKNSQEER